MSKYSPGWVFIYGARLWHYIDEDGRSLCRRWLYLGNSVPEQSNNYSPDNCGTCRKKLNLPGDAS
jgi:hypothetical protein